MAERKPRDAQTREQEARAVSWQRPSSLPDPIPQPGWRYRWIRTSIMGDSDSKNVSSRYREGWQPVKAADHPEMQILSDVDSRFEGNIEVGGLMLCKAPAENVEAREKALRQQTELQIQSVDQTYMRDSDPRMPILEPERTTRTTFGK